MKLQNRLMKVFIYYGIALLIFGLDYASKKIVVMNFSLWTSMRVWGDFFYITYIVNRGAAFGMMENQQLFFIAITLVVVMTLIIYMQRNVRQGSTLNFIGVACVLGGALGNFLDRVLYGEVVDFLQFNFGNYTFPIFNLADLAITCGAGLIILDVIIGMKQEKKVRQNG